MTLVAAFNYEGIYFVISDLLISSTHEPKLTPPLPSSTLHKSTPAPPHRFTSDLLQKVAVINDKCVIAWAGWDIEAKMVLEDLEAIAERNNLSAETIQEYFENYDYEEKAGRTSFVGWVHDDGVTAPISFAAEEIEDERFGKIACAGSGVNFLRQLVEYHYFLHRSEEANDDPNEVFVIGENSKDPLYFAMSLIGDLLVHEAMDQAPVKSGFGGMYQIFFLRGGSFIPVQSYTFFILEIVFDQQGGTHQPKLFVKYDMDDELAVVHAHGFPEGGRSGGFRSAIPTFRRPKGSYKQEEINRTKNAEREINANWQIVCSIVSRDRGDRKRFFCDTKMAQSHQDHNVYFESFQNFEYSVSSEYLKQLSGSF